MLASFPHSVDMVDVNENYQWYGFFSAIYMNIKYMYKK